MMKSLIAATLLIGQLVFAADVETPVVAATPAAIETKATYNEAEIPLKFAGDKGVVVDKDTSSAKMLFGFLIVAGLLGAAVYFVRKYGNNKTANSSLMQIKVTAQHYLGPKKSIAVIRVAGESLLIGITDNQINLIKGLSIIDDDVATTGTANNFPKLNSAEADAEDLETQIMGGGSDEEFSFADLKSTVAEKLKSVRGFQ